MIVLREGVLERPERAFTDEASLGAVVIVNRLKGIPWLSLDTSQPLP